MDPLEAADRVLLYIAAHSDAFASRVGIKVKNDYPLVYGQDHDDLQYVLDHLLTQGLIQLLPAPKDGWRLTPRGWDAVRQLRHSESGGSKAFVAMWFDPSLDEAWAKGLTPGLKGAGYDPVRVDLVEHNEKICDRIVVEVRSAALVVADVTGNRAGVYFEAGLAMGLGKPVIWTARSCDFAPHFDTRQYNHILWDDPVDLRQKLENRILATVGMPRGPAL